MTSYFSNKVRKRSAKALPSLTWGVAAALLGLMMLPSCVRSGDTLDECAFPLRLHFSYTYNREGRDLFADEVDCVSLRLYDSTTGRYVAGTDIEATAIGADGTYEWRVPVGRFNLVAWGGVRSRYALLHSESLDGHRLTLPVEADGTAAQAGEHAWHRIVLDVLINGDLTPAYEVDLLKLTNDVTVTVTDVAASSGARSSVTPLTDLASSATISAGNGLYGYDGKIHADSHTVTYLPESATASAAVESHLFTTLSLERDDDSQLKVTYNGTPIYDGTLSGLIDRQPDIKFDLDDDFRLNFDVDSRATFLAVSVTVNDWKVTEYNVSLK